MYIQIVFFVEAHSQSKLLPKTEEDECEEEIEDRKYQREHPAVIQHGFTS